MSQLSFQRLDNILNYLIVQTSPVTLENLSKFTKVSSRTLRSDIKAINDHIISHGAEITLLRKKGYLLSYTDKTSFDNFWSKDNSGTFLFTSTTSRLRYLLRIFLTSDTYITQEFLLNILYVSQNTLYNDFRNLKDLLDKYNLKIINKSNLGYLLVGDEADIRYTINTNIFQENLSEFITSTNTVEKDICNNIDYQQFTKLFWDHLQDLIKFDSDYFHRNAFSNILLAISRIKAGHIITDFSQKTCITRTAQQQIDSFDTAIAKQFHITLTEDEKNYINYILSSNLPHIIQAEDDQENLQLAQHIVDDILTNLKNKTGASWVSDKTLRDNLYDHISRLLQIHTINSNRHNPILDSVKNNFPYPFELAVIAIQDIEQTYQIVFSEDEISYIALYFASTIENFKEPNKLLSLAIICGTGITLSSIIESKVRRKFPNLFSNIKKMSYLEFETAKNDDFFDLIITTIPLSHHEKNIIFLDINYFDTAFQQIERVIQSISSDVIPLNLYQPEHFFVIDTPVTKEELFQKINQHLINNTFVSRHFIADVIEREAISNTMINDVVALPHPLGNSVKTSTIFTVIAPKGVTWDQTKKVKFIFFIAIRPEDVNKVQLIYDELLDFISSDKKQEALLKTPDFNTLISILSTDETLLLP